MRLNAVRYSGIINCKYFKKVLIYRDLQNCLIGFININIESDQTKV